MPTPTRTLNRLPFNDLEPKRFEDLIRQLIYDFRTWRQLEATGRAGSDDGYDARGWEIAPDAETGLSGEDQDEGADELKETAFTDRRWMLQCKREGAIGPAKLRQYLEEIPLEERAQLHGFIFAACCEFSKKTRDAFRDWCRASGVRECQMWGRSEIEDMLFQPKNDGLLFAYFGISLQIRQRTMKTALRARLAMRRKAKRLLKPSTGVVLRKPDDSNFPYRGQQQSLNALPWRMREFKGLHPRGVIVVLAQYFAYLDPDGKRWDVADKHNRAPWQDWWMTDEEKACQDAAGHALSEFSWSEIPEDCRAWMDLEAIIPYEDIFDIDAEEDDYFQGPTIFVTFEHGKKNWPCSATLDAHAVISERDGQYIETAPARQLLSPLPDDRVAIFPAEYRSESWLSGL
jgi:hypothetical protein